MTELLRKQSNNKFANIKEEAELSLKKLGDINENSIEEMNKFVKNYGKKNGNCHRNRSANAKRFRNQNGEKA